MNLPHHDGETGPATEDRLRAALAAGSPIDLDEHLGLVLATVMRSRRAAGARLLEQSVAKAGAARRFLDARH